MSYLYRIYGLKVKCQFKLANYQIGDFAGKHDVLIRMGKIKKPAEGQEKTIYLPYSIINEDNYYLDVAGIAQYLIKGNNQLIIQKYDGATKLDVCAFLFDTVFTVLFIKNNIFLFHASAVAFGKNAYMFCGPSGIGKSTLAASLAANKHARLIEDDRCFITQNKKTGSFQIKNQYPFIELWKPQVKLAHRISGVKVTNAVRQNIQKFRANIRDHVPKRAVKLDQIILLSMTHLEDRISYEKVEGIKKVQLVKRFSHLDDLIPALGKNKEHFKQISDVVKGIAVHHINKSRLTKLEDLLTFIDNEILRPTIN